MMERVCPSCGMKNVTGRTICKQCQQPLFTDASVTPEIDHSRRIFLLLIGSAVAPLGVLLLYVAIAMNAAFTLNGDSQGRDTVVQLAALISGEALISMLPGKVWVRLLLFVLYLPCFAVLLFLFLGYFGCAIGRGCL